MKTKGIFLQYQPFFPLGFFPPRSSRLFSEAVFAVCSDHLKIKTWKTEAKLQRTQDAELQARRRRRRISFISAGKNTQRTVL